MSTHPTYRYIQDGRSEGPYLKSQIVHMANAGTIRGDATIQSVDDESTQPLGDFLHAEHTETAKSVEVKKVDVSFDDTVKMAGKWIGAIVLIAAVIGVLYLVISGLSDLGDR